MLGVWCGANRSEHGEVTRHNPVLQRLSEQRIALLRADSGFALAMRQPLQRALV